ncbi:hypothetical protein NDU88_007986 [Pleurodeles waltl]|uniref:Uncharacterized protein n=1 Tax=Pleurodeles waltl TaxID=8319 RepID=A0AAV7PVF3_PLEWA|nr:hypothetical protein NDU88_007986 [Pleurodeles waltl]
MKESLACFCSVLPILDGALGRKTGCHQRQEQEATSPESPDTKGPPRSSKEPCNTIQRRQEYVSGALNRRTSHICPVDPSPILKTDCQGKHQDWRWGIPLRSPESSSQRHPLFWPLSAARNSSQQHTEDSSNKRDSTAQWLQWMSASAPVRSDRRWLPIWRGPAPSSHGRAPAQPPARTMAPASRLPLLQ